MGFVKPSEQEREDRFWSRVDSTKGPSECWPWRGYRSPKGYGRVMSFDGRQQAHRIAFFLTHGYWPDVCRHTCDNPPCCNPAHLLDGTHADNIRDRDSRGRHKAFRGTEHWAAKLCEQDVIAIRFALSLAGCSQRELAKAYGITPAAISTLARRKTWRHI